MCFVSLSLVQYNSLLALLRRNNLFVFVKQVFYSRRKEKKMAAPFLKSSPSPLSFQIKYVISKMKENNRQADVFYDNQPFIPKENITTI
jgi:hypothetical protein